MVPFHKGLKYIEEVFFWTYHFGHLFHLVRIFIDSGLLQKPVITKFSVLLPNLTFFQCFLQTLVQIDEIDGSY